MHLCKGGVSSNLNPCTLPKTKYHHFFEIYPTPLGTDDLESNPIHLGMYTGNMIFHFMDDIPMYREGLDQFKDVLMNENPKNCCFLTFTLHLWCTDESESNHIDFYMISGIKCST